MNSEPYRITVIVSKYPAYSHGFIATEIAALEKAGIEVSTVSINLSDAVDLPVGRRHLEVKGSGLMRIVLGILSEWLLHPVSSIATFRLAICEGVRSCSPKALVFQLFYLAESLYVASRIRSWHPDHLHAHFANNGADVARLVASQLGRRGRRGRGIGWSMTVHGPSDFDHAKRWRLRDKVADADMVRCISYFAADQVVRLTSCEPEKLRVIPMGAFVDARVPAVSRPRDQTFRVLFVGRLVEKKAPGILLDAVLSLPDHALYGNTELIFVGDGPLSKELAAAATKLSPRTIVTFRGAMAHVDVLRQYEDVDVFALPSYSEGLPVVLMEAMAAAIPVVTTGVAGIPELVVDGETGLLVQPGSVEDLREALERLREDASLRQRLGESGRDAVQRNYSALRNASILAADMRAARTP